MLSFNHYPTLLTKQVIHICVYVCVWERERDREIRVCNHYSDEKSTSNLYLPFWLNSLTSRCKWSDWNWYLRIFIVYFVKCRSLRLYFFVAARCVPFTFFVSELFWRTHTLPLSLSLTHTHTHTHYVSLSHTNTQTHTLSLSHTQTHTRTLFLYLFHSLSDTHTHRHTTLSLFLSLSLSLSHAQQRICFLCLKSFTNASPETFRVIRTSLWTFFVSTTEAVKFSAFFIRLERAKRFFL